MIILYNAKEAVLESGGGHISIDQEIISLVEYILPPISSYELFWSSDNARECNVEIFTILGHEDFFS